MESLDVTINGNKFHLTRDLVIRAMRKQVPGRIQTYVVDIEGVQFPVKQALAQTLQIKSTEFVSTRARDILSRLGFQVVNVEEEAGESVPGELATTRALALDLAVALHAAHTAVPADVLRTAETFEGWLARR